MYPLLRSILFRFPAEAVHHVSFGLLRAIGILPPLRAVFWDLLSSKDSALEQELCGITFPHPLGLAAGFDKNAHGVNTWGSVGFGFAEVGTITPLAQPGNEQPRLFRLPKNRALINRMGFNNYGAGAASAALKTNRRDKRSVPIGVNIGKNKITELAAVVDDYVQCTRLVSGFADFLVINVSSPNTPGLRALQNVSALTGIVTALQQELSSSELKVPIFIKISPDLSDYDIVSIADTALELNIAGIVCCNTTTSREGLICEDNEGHDSHSNNLSGGLSGAPLKARSLAVLRLLRSYVGDRLILVSVGGIETGDDVWERIISGANLVESYTGYVYGGPLWPTKIHRELSKKLRESGLKHLREAVGSAIPSGEKQQVQSNKLG